MDKEILKDRRVKYGIGIIIILILVFLLLKGCGSLKSSILTVDDYIMKVDALVVEEQETQEEWNRLLDTTTFEDLCSEVYASKFEELGQQFIDTYTVFIAMEIEGNKNIMIPNYQLYVTYFTIYKEIGEQLQLFADTIREGNYQEALGIIEVLRERNQQIPIIE